MTNTVNDTIIEIEMSLGEMELLKAAALISGVSVEEFVLKAAERMSTTVNRLQDVRDAYFSKTDSMDGELAVIEDGIVKLCGIVEPTSAQVKSVFDMLDEELIGKGISCGFDDTEVGEEISQFMEKKAEAVKCAVGKAK